MKKRYVFIYVDKQDDGTGTLKRTRKDSLELLQRMMALEACRQENIKISLMG